MTGQTAQAAKDRVLDAAGGASALAKKLHITRSAVSQWTKIPAERVSEIEAATGVPPHEQRPDLFRKLDDNANST
jgi:DNA-binding transcriptional regulator YdaS (Cro superfamily)